MLSIYWPWQNTTLGSVMTQTIYLKSRLKSCKIIFVHSFFINNKFFWNSAQSTAVTAVLCAKFQKESQTRMANTSKLDFFNLGLRWIYGTRVVFICMEIFSNVNLWPVFTPQPLRAPGYCHRLSGRVGRRAAGQTSPVNTLTSIIFHGSFSNLARTFITLRSRTSSIMKVLPH